MSAPEDTGGAAPQRPDGEVIIRFEDVYKSRWSSLREALAGPTQQVTWESPFEGVTDGHYAVDGASPVAALAVQAKPGDRVLDLCAAPGGKALAVQGDMSLDGAAATLWDAAEAAMRATNAFDYRPDSCRELAAAPSPTISPSLPLPLINHPGYKVHLINH